MTPLPPKMTLDQAMHFLQIEPGAYGFEVQHDNGCPTLRTQHDKDCAAWCKPIYRIHRFTRVPAEPQPKVKRGRR